MTISIPKEIKQAEKRVGMTPAGVHLLCEHGHRVCIETQAGLGSNFYDQQYIEAGAEIVDSAKQVYERGELIVKVKEPLDSEYSFIQPHHTVFGYFHFAGSKPLTDAMIATKATCLAFETVELENRQLPLLIPMSEVAGKMAVQEGAKYLESPQQGKGVLLGGVTGVTPGKVLVLGGGIAGTNAALVAAGMGADVTVLDLSLPRLRYLNEIMPANVKALYSNPYTIMEEAEHCDLLILSVLIPGTKAPKLIKKSMLKNMERGTVLVDIAVDQGGCAETTRPTSHAEPVFVEDGVLHYCVTNMPGAVPVTSTIALANATLPYILQVADLGWQRATEQNPALKKGLNIVDGEIVYDAIKKAFL